MKLSIRLRKSSSREAMTLVEFMVGMAVGALVLTVIALTMWYSTRSFAGLSNYLEMSHQSRLALDTISSDVRHCTHLISYTEDPPELVFGHETLEDPDLDPVVGTLKYAFHEGFVTVNGLVYTNVLVRSYDTNGVPIEKVILTGCDDFKFTLYQNNPDPASGTSGSVPVNYTTIDPAECKLVELKWRCFREIGGTQMIRDGVRSRKVNTEDMQTARIVLRN
jgi:hypothetical protein